MNLVGLVDPFPFIFQFAPLVLSAKKGTKDIIGVLEIPDDVTFAPVGKPRRGIVVEESRGLIDWENSASNRCSFNVEKSMYIVGKPRHGIDVYSK